MQDFSIPDSAIKASSSYDDSSVGPENGRQVIGILSALKFISLQSVLRHVG